MEHEGKLLKQFLQNQDISVLELANKLGKSRHTIYSYFRTNTLQAAIKRQLKEAIGFELQDGEIVRGKTQLVGVPVFQETVADMKHYEALEPTHFLTIPYFQDCTFACRLDDDSMSPRFKRGSVIVCKEITGDYVTPGKPYLIITKSDKLLVVRYIMKINGRALLRANNHDFYPDHEIQKEEIEKLYLIKGQIEM